MQIWSILGLEEPTDDLKVIKRAYAKKLKVTRPEDNPKDFMALREALEVAKSYASGRSDNIMFVNTNSFNIQTPPAQTSNDRPTVQIKSQPDDNQIELINHPADEDIQHLIDEEERKTEIPIPSIMDEMMALMNDPFGRADVKQWKKLFNDSRLDSIDDANDFEDGFRNYLLDRFGYYSGDETQKNIKQNPRILSAKVGNYIFNQIGWRESSLRPHYVQDQITWLREDMDVINRNKPISKSYAPEIDYDDSGVNYTPMIFVIIAILVIRFIYSQYQ